MAVSKGTRVPRLRRMPNYMHIYAYSATARSEPFCASRRRSIATQGMSHDNWLEQLRRGGLDLAILLAVANGPRSGLAIIEHLEASHALVVGEGTIYPILGRLTKEGLLEANWVEGEAPHPRKYYRLTKAGARRLREMKADWRAFAEKIDRLIAATREGATEDARESH